MYVGGSAGRDGRGPGHPHPRRSADRPAREVSNGSGLPKEQITNLLVFSFLKNCPNCNFLIELEALGHGLPMPGRLWEEHDELQTDGNRSSLLSMERREADSQSQEQAIRIIALRLAQIGDEMERVVHPSLVQNLARRLMDMSLSEEDRMGYLQMALDQLMQNCPKDMELEKAKLMLTMLLAKKVANHTPSLLHDIFRTTVNFINQNLLSYVRNLARNLKEDMGLGAVQLREMLADCVTGSLCVPL
ncbi:BH3-interacting domain death agonist [Rhynchocyon petersi]